MMSISQSMLMHNFCIHITVFLKCYQPLETETFIDIFWSWDRDNEYDISRGHV